MTSDEIRKARATIRDEWDDLDGYFEGLSNILYIRAYEKLYLDAKSDILTWKDAWMAFRINERQQLYWESHRSYSHFVLLSHSITEYLSSRILFEYVNPSRGQETFLAALEGLSQRDRQNMLFELGLISGQMNDLMNHVRGRRNDFAHEVQPHFELDYDEHPLVILNEVKEVCIHLIHLLYCKPYSEIVELLEEIFSESFPMDYSEAPLGKLIDIYQFEVEEGPIYDQRLPREFRRRGIDPEEAPAFEKIEVIDYINEMGDAPADSQEMSLVQLKAVPFLSEGIHVDKNTTIEFQFEVSSDSMLYDMHSPAVDDFEYYGFLFVDGRVRDVHPVDSEGCPIPKDIDVDRRAEVGFNYHPRESGTKNIKIGMFLTHKHFEYYVNVFEDTLRVYGPWG